MAQRKAGGAPATTDTGGGGAAPAAVLDAINGTSLRDMMADVSGGEISDTGDGSGNMEAIDAGLEPGLDVDMSMLESGEDGILDGAAGGPVPDGTQPPGEAATSPASPGTTPTEGPLKGLTVEEIENLKSDADFGRAWEGRFRADPVGVVTALLTSLPAHLQQQALQMAGAAPGQPAQGGAAQTTAPAPPAGEPFDPAKYPGLTAQEAYIEHNRAGLDALLNGQGNQQSGIPKEFYGQLQNEFTRRDEIYGDAVAEVHALRHMVQAISEATGLSFPALDKTKVIEAMRGGKTLQDAVAEQYSTVTKAAVERHKQKQASQSAPRTPGDGGSSTGYSDGPHLRDIMASRGWLEPH